MAADRDDQAVRKNIGAAVGFSRALPPDLIAQALATVLHAAARRSGAADLITTAVLEHELTDRDLMRRLVARLPAALCAGPAEWLTAELTSKTELLLRRVS